MSRKVAIGIALGVAFGLAFGLCITAIAIADPGGWDTWRVALAVIPSSMLVCGTAGGVGVV